MGMYVESVLARHGGELAGSEGLAGGVIIFCFALHSSVLLFLLKTEK